MTPTSGRKALASSRTAVATALLLGLSTVCASAQTVSDDPRTTPGQTVVPKDSPTQIPLIDPVGANRPDPPTTGSVARDAIRVPAFGTTQPTSMTLARHTPRKRLRVGMRHAYAMDVPPPAFTRPVYYRFGYGYGPGVRLYRW